IAVRENAAQLIDRFRVDAIPPNIPQSLYDRGRHVAPRAKILGAHMLEPDFAAVDVEGPGGPIGNILVPRRNLEAEPQHVRRARTTWGDRPIELSRQCGRHLVNVGTEKAPQPGIESRPVK